jgi:methyltransferase (TIGR00027 family)
MARNPAAGTAFGPMVLSAVEHLEPPARRLVDDDLAGRFLPPSLRAVVAAARLTSLRTAMIKVSERTAPGLWANIACRKRYVDDNLTAALPDIDAVVVLGAGLDTRGCRLARHRDVPVFEVDLPINAARKRSVVTRALGTGPPSIRLVPVDFERDDLMAALVSQGYRRDARTFVVWEGVTQYLTEAAVRSTFHHLSDLAVGSRIDFTYVRSDFIDGRELYGAPTLYRRFRTRREVWRYGMQPDDIAEFLIGFGWRLLEQAGPEEFMSRYVAPSGRNLRTSQIEWSAYAEKV